MYLFIALPLVISIGSFWLAYRADKRATAADMRSIAAENRAIAADEREEKRRIRDLFARFSISNRRFNSLIENGSGNRGWHSASRDLLTVFNLAVPKEFAAGNHVALVLECEDKHVERVAFFLNGSRIDFFPNVRIDSSSIPTLLCVIEYPFDPSAFGVTQRIEVRMVNEDMQQTDFYETEHGKRIFRRIKPPSELTVASATVVRA